MGAMYGVSMPLTVEAAVAVEGDPPVVRTLRRSERSTRSRRILRCGHDVPAGTSYTEWVGLVDGEFSTLVECAFCRGEQYGLPRGRYSVLRDL